MRLNNDKPFFMTLATPACHAPFTPAKRHSQNFPNEKAVRNPSFNYSSENVRNVINSTIVFSNSFFTSRNIGL